MYKASRRQFMLGAAAAAASVALPIRNVLGANDAINLAVVGLGGRGSEHVKWFGGVPGVRIVALCDPDSKRTANAQKRVPEAKMYDDVRKVLEDKSIDGVVIASCNHWHALSAIWALQAGKDVYVEKPVSNNVWEGRKIVEAARKYKRICQGGTQQRSDPCQAEIRDFIKSGKLGKMQWIRGNRYGVRQSIGKVAQPLKPPAEVNYDLWLGPAQDEPMHRKDFHYDWHWIWNTGSGEMGNWGVHILDDIRNMLFDKSTLPVRILAGGGRAFWDDGGETPNAHFVYFDTGPEVGVPVIFDLSNLPMKPNTTIEPAFRGIRSGYVIQFENGYYAGGRNGGWAYDKDGKRLQQFKGDGGGKHAGNFIDAMRKRDSSILKADIECAHYSSSWCHLANVAYRLGQAYSKDQALAAAKGYAPWQEMIESFGTRLEALGVNPAKANMKLSGFLEIDPKKETFVGPTATPQALALLRREYRKPYVVPEQV